MYEAFGHGDVPHVLAQMALDVEWIETEAEGIPTHGTFASPQEVLKSVFAKVPLFRDGKVCRNDNFHDTALWVAALS